MALLLGCGQIRCPGERICGASSSRHLRLSYISLARSDVRDQKEADLYSRSCSRANLRPYMRSPMSPPRQPRCLLSPRSTTTAQAARTPTPRGSSAGLHHKAYCMGSCIYHRILLSLAAKFLETQRCCLDHRCRLHKPLAGAHDGHKILSVR